MSAGGITLVMNVPLSMGLGTLLAIELASSFHFCSSDHCQKSTRQGMMHMGTSE